MASIELEEQEERARMQAERAAEGRDPNEDVRKYWGSDSREDDQPSGSNDVRSGSSGQSGQLPSGWSPDPDHPGAWLPPGAGPGWGRDDYVPPFTSAPSPPQSPAERQAAVTAEIQKWYQATLGRGMDANELATEYNNYQRYGGESIQKNLTERAEPTLSAGGRGGDFDTNRDGKDDRTGLPWNPNYRPGGSGPSLVGDTRHTPEDGGRPGSPSFQNTSPRFDDPAQRLIEDYALDRFRHLVNPDQNSGTAMYENYLKELVAKLKAPVYSDQEASQLKASVYDSMEVERNQTKQRWLETISRRGMAPSSGPALDGLLKIDQHYDQLRTVADREFATQAIGLRKAQDASVAGVYGTLAGSEEGRLTDALTYATVPKQLSDNAFQQGLQLVGAGGSPNSLLQSALQIATSQENARLQASQNRAQLTQGLLSYLGYLFG